MNAFVKIFQHIITINKVKTQLFIEYELEPVLFPEYIAREIPAKGTPIPSEIPGWATAYSFFERDYVEIQGERIYFGDRRNQSERYKIGEGTIERR